MAMINKQTREVLAARGPGPIRPKSNSFVLDWEDDSSVCRFMQDELFQYMHHGKTTVNQIATKLGMNHSTISRIAYGETKAPRAGTVIKILRFLGYKVRVHHG
jgi:DNA-binding Xre family transcriptional regulator